MDIASDSDAASGSAFGSDQEAPGSDDSVVLSEGRRTPMSMSQSGKPSRTRATACSAAPDRKPQVKQERQPAQKRKTAAARAAPAAAYRHAVERQELGSDWEEELEDEMEAAGARVFG